MLEFILNNDQFIFKIGRPNKQQSFIISLEDTQFLANQMTADMQSQITHQEYTWEVGSWKIYRPTIATERPRDIKRKRFRVHYKDRSWAFEKYEFERFVIDCQAALKQFQSHES